MYIRLKNTLGICYPVTETAKEKKALVKENQKKRALEQIPGIVTSLLNVSVQS